MLNCRNDSLIIDILYNPTTKLKNTSVATYATTVTTKIYKVCSKKKKKS